MCAKYTFFSEHKILQTIVNKKDENYLTGNYCCVVDVLESYLKKIEMKVSNQKTRKML